jgi:GxxExxY protein
MQQPEWIPKEVDDIAKIVVDAAFQVHIGLGPGLLESVYEQCLAHELELRGLKPRRQVEIPVQYKGFRAPAGFKADMVIEPGILLEIKSVEVLLPVHRAQIMTYLKLSGIPLGFLMNFNVSAFRDGVKRIILRPPTT